MVDGRVPWSPRSGDMTACVPVDEVQPTMRLINCTNTNTGCSLSENVGLQDNVPDRIPDGNTVTCGDTQIAFQHDAR